MYNLLAAHVCEGLLHLTSCYKKARLAEIKWGLVTVLKSVSAFSIFLPSEREGGDSYELFMRKVTLRGHGKEPAVSLLLLLPPHVFLLSSPLYFSSCDSRNAKIDTFILGLNLWVVDIFL